MRIEKTDEYRDWIDSLKDQGGRARILMRVDRLIHGNPGDHRNLTNGVTERPKDAASRRPSPAGIKESGKATFP